MLSIIDHVRLTANISSPYPADGSVGPSLRDPLGSLGHAQGLDGSRVMHYMSTVLNCISSTWESMATPHNARSSARSSSSEDLEDAQFLAAMGRRVRGAGNPRRQALSALAPH